MASFPATSCNFIGTTAISLAQLQISTYVGIVQTNNGKTANAMSQLQMKCHNCNSNGTTAKTKSPKMCHVPSKAETDQIISYSGAIIICPICRSASFSVGEEMVVPEKLGIEQTDLKSKLHSM